MHTGNGGKRDDDRAQYISFLFENKSSQQELRGKKWETVTREPTMSLVWKH